LKIIIIYFLIFSDFQKQVLRMLTYLTSEVRYLESKQAEILKKI